MTAKERAEVVLSGVEGAPHRYAEREIIRLEIEAAEERGRVEMREKCAVLADDIQSEAVILVHGVIYENGWDSCAAELAYKIRTLSTSPEEQVKERTDNDKQ